MDVDRRAAGAFARQLVQHVSSAMTVTAIEIGHRTGLLDVLTAGPVTRHELAERADCRERYVREWLGILVTAGVVVHDAATDTFVLPPEHAAALTAPTPYNLSGMATVATAAAAQTDRLVEAFHNGGGIGYDEQAVDTDEVLDRLSRHRYVALLADTYLGQVPEVVDQLVSGARVLELGCGRGQAARVIARAFPASEVVGLDLSEQAVAEAARIAREEGLANVSFVAGTASAPPPGPWDLVCAFDVVHDLAEPYAALAATREAVGEDGLFLMIDSGAPPTLAEQAELPWAPMMYGVSLAHCMTVSLAQDGEGLGAMWGEQAARQALTDAGFTSVETHPLKGDPMDLLYVARTG